MRSLTLNPFYFAVLAFLFCCSSSTATIGSVSKTVKSDDLEFVLSVYFDLHQQAATSPLLEFVIENRGAYSLFLLPWGTPWEEGLTRDIFNISRDAKRARYIGPVVKRRAPKREDYVEIPPGSSIQSTLKISDYYEVTTVYNYGVVYSQTALSFLVKGQPVRFEIADIVVISK